MCVVAPTFAAELRITRDETSKVTEGLQIYRSLGKSSRFWPRVCVQHLREMALQAYLVVLGRFLIVPVHVPRLPNIYCALRFTPSSALKRLRYYHHLLMCRFFCTLYCSLLLLAYFPLCVLVAMVLLPLLSTRLQTIEHLPCNMQLAWLSSLHAGSSCKSSLHWPPCMLLCSAMHSACSM